MKKRHLMAILLIIMMISSKVMAASPIVLDLYFTGTTANCSVSIKSLGKAIDATLELWQGSTLVDSWHGTGISLVTISGTHICTPVSGSC